MNLNQLTGADLMAARTHIGLSISAVAKLTGINRNTLSQFEQEKASLSGSEKKRLAGCYEERGYHFDEPQTTDEIHYWLSVLEKRVLPRSGLEGKRWQGWYFDEGKLVTPLGHRLGTAQIEDQQNQINQTRAVYRQAHKVREHAKSGLHEAGESWFGWQFKGGFLVSPDERKIAADELYVMMVGYDAMTYAKAYKKPPIDTAKATVLNLETKCS